VRSRNYRSEGVVLARRNYSEADRILVIYSKHYGKLSLLAKGVRKVQSRKGGSLEVFNYIRFSASRGKGLDLMAEVEIINSFSLIRKDLRRVAVAYFLLETVGRLTRDSERNEQFFFLLLNALEDLQRTKFLRKLREKFIKDSLVLLGFWPKNKSLLEHDKVLESIVEREMTSLRVGKKLIF